MNKEPGGKYCDQLCGNTRRGKGRGGGTVMPGWEKCEAGRGRGGTRKNTL